MRNDKLVSNTEEKIRSSGNFLQLGPHLFLHSSTKLLIKAVGIKKTPIKIFHPLMATQPSSLRDDFFVRNHYMISDESQWSGHYRQLRRGSECNYAVVELDEPFLAVVPTMKTWICKGCMLTCFGENMASRDQSYVNHMKGSNTCMGIGMIECRGVVSLQTPVAFFVLADENTKSLMLPIPEPLPQVLRARRKKDDRENRDKALVDEIQKENQEKMRQLVGDEERTEPEKTARKRRRTVQDVPREAQSRRQGLLEAVVEYSDEEVQDTRPTEEEEEEQEKESSTTGQLTLEEVVFKTVQETMSQLSAVDDSTTPIESLLALVDKDPSAAKRVLPTVMLKFLKDDIMKHGEKEDIVQVSLRNLPAELMVSNKEKTLMMTVRLVRHVGETLTFTVSVTMNVGDDTPDNTTQVSHEASAITLEKVCSLLKVLSVATTTVLAHSSKGEAVSAVRLKDVVFHCLKTVQVDDVTCMTLFKTHLQEELEK